MAWRTKIRSAKWRGVEFEVESSSVKIGRRTVRHEYPLRDEPAVEDLGRATREFRLDGFVIGDDYFATRDRLVAVSEQPGSGVLVHPYFGEMFAVCEACEISENAEEGRAASVRFLFVEAGSLSFPTGAALSSGRIEGAAATLKKNALSDFVADFDAALGQFDDAVGTFTDLIEEARDALSVPGAMVSAKFAAFSKIDALLEDASSLAGKPQELAEQVETMFESFEDFYALKGFFKHGTDSDPLPDVTPSEQQTKENRDALDRLFSRIALAELGIQTPLLDWSSFEDAVATRDEVVALILTEEQSETGGAGADAFGAIVDLRTAVYETITEKAANLARLETVQLDDPIPAIVLSFDLYGDPTRDEEIANRNRVLDPLFSFGGLRVLSK